MTDKNYYRKYTELLDKHERISGTIAWNGLKSIFKSASKLYAENPNVPIELLVRDSDTLEIIKDIYDSVGIEMAKFVDSTFPKVKSSGLTLQTKAKAPQPYKIDNSPKINYWKQEFLRFTQSADCAKKVSNVTNTTRDQIRKIMTEAGEKGLSHKQIAKGILAEGGQINTKQRALLIARTENAIASNKGAYFASQSSGLVLYKKWIARSGDSRTREFHSAMIGRDAIPMNELFDVGGEKMLHPGDSANGGSAKNICNCRCIVGFIPASPALTSPQQEPVINRPAQLDIFETVKPLQRVFKPAKNLREAEAFVTENNIAKNVDYIFMKDVQVANEINEALFIVNEKYPFRTLSNIGADTSNANAMMSANYATLNINHKSFSTLKKARSMHANAVTNFADRLAENIEICTSNLSKSVTAKQKTYWRNILRDLEQRKNYSRFTVSYTEESVIKDTTFHELGHVLHDSRTGLINSSKAVLPKMLDGNGNLTSLAQDLNNELETIFQKAKANKDIYKISYYAQTNNREFFCESFVMHMHGDLTLPSYIGEFIERYLQLTL